MLKLIIVKYVKHNQTKNKVKNKNHSVNLDPRQKITPAPGTSKASTRHQPCTATGK